MGLSLEQIDILYERSTILKSNSFRKQILAENVQSKDQHDYLSRQGGLSASKERAEDTEKQKVEV
jgi:hypothetical protein